jgi:oligopeptide transport system substrate-binding protein
MKAKRLIPLTVLVSLVLATAIWMIATVWAEPAPPEQQQIVVQSGVPESFDPPRVMSEPEVAIARMLWRGLYQLEATPDGGVQAVPAMAAAEPTVNGNVYTVGLKSELKWSDGQPLTAMDFEYGIKRECDPDVASPYQLLLGESVLNIVGCDAYFLGQGTRDAVGVTAINATTLEITLVAPKPTFTTIMSLWVALPARQDVIDAHGEDWTDPANIVVNGPFILTGLVPGTGGQAVLEPNPEWALQPEPTLRKITIKFMGDLEAAFQAFQDGELNMTSVLASAIPTIEADPSLSAQFLKVGAARIWAVEMQMEDPVLSKDNVRLALSRAIDREKLVEDVYNDAYLPATYWLVQGLPGFQGNAAFENIIGYNSGAAQTALADAGYPNGEGFPILKLTVLDRPDRLAEATFLQNSWDDILGINVEIEAVDAQTRSDIFNSENFDLFPGGWGNDYPDPENSLIGLFDTDGANNKYNCSDPDIDAKLSAAAAETNNATRIQLLQEAETLIVTSLCGVAPVYQTAFLYLVKSNIGGVRPNGQIDSAMPGGWCPECWFVEAEDQDGDGFSDARETYMGTDPLDACPDGSTDDAWPLDVNKNGQISVVGDVLNFRGRIGATPGAPNWWQRLDFNADRLISVVGDVLMYRGMIGETCT